MAQSFRDIPLSWDECMKQTGNLEESHKILVLKSAVT